MKLFKLHLVIAAILPLMFSASTFAEDQRITENEQTNSYDLKNPNVQRKLAFVHTVLLKTRKNHSHRLNGAIGNRYFLRKVDGAEAVFDKAGGLVTNCANKITPNNAHPVERPMAHFSLDVLPWMEWGNCNNQATRAGQRVAGFVNDIRDSLEHIAVTDGGFYLPTHPNLSEENFAAFFLFVTQAERAGFDIQTFMKYDLFEERYREKYLRILEYNLLDEIAHNRT